MAKHRDLLSAELGHFTCCECFDLRICQGLERIAKVMDRATLIRSVFPLDRIWRASQPEAPDEKVDLATGGANLLVQGAGFVTLEAGDAAFLAQLDGAATLEQAAEAGRAVDSRFDLSTCFAQFLGMSAIAALQQ